MCKTWGGITPGLRCLLQGEARDVLLASPESQPSRQTYSPRFPTSPSPAPNIGLGVLILTNPQRKGWAPGDSPLAHMESWGQACFVCVCLGVWGDQGVTDQYGLPPQSCQNATHHRDEAGSLQGICFQRVPHPRLGRQRCWLRYVTLIRQTPPQSRLSDVMTTGPQLSHRKAIFKQFKFFVFLQRQDTAHTTWVMCIVSSEWASHP